MLQRSIPWHTSSLESTKSYVVLKNPREGVLNLHKDMHKGSEKAEESLCLQKY